MVSKLNEAQYLRLIDNAYRAYNNCGTDWGKNYWTEVICALNRYFGRTQ